VRASDPLHPSATIITDPERELPERATPSRLGEIPGGSINPRLNTAAESVGTALGSAVVQVRRLPDRLQEAKQRFTVIRGRKGEQAKSAMNDAVAKARETGEELADKARVAGDELKVTAQEKLAQARTRTERMAHDYPLHVIGASAAAGMLMGIVLRLWRDHAS
jgi:ElaB/YqjD/DUF883 family membrane-anchored ribosome-binding protein